MSKKKTPVPMVWVKCPTCEGSGVRPGRTLASAFAVRAVDLKEAMADLRCFDCDGKGKVKRPRSNFDAATAAQLEPADGR